MICRTAIQKAGWSRIMLPSAPIPREPPCRPNNGQGNYPLPRKTAKTRRDICLFKSEGRPARPILGKDNSVFPDRFLQRQEPADGLCLIVQSAESGVPARLRERTMTLDLVVLNPLIALIAGILILLVPRLLNFVVAIYLIVIGILGLVPHFQ